MSSKLFTGINVTFLYSRRSALFGGWGRRSADPPLRGLELWGARQRGEAGEEGWWGWLRWAYLATA